MNTIAELIHAKDEQISALEQQLDFNEGSEEEIFFETAELGGSLDGCYFEELLEEV